MGSEKKEKLDIVRPQYPLPAEIQSMKRDETVCKYCGVSYLIHSEIKALEDRLKEVETDLLRCRGAEQREKELRVELSKAHTISNDLLHRVEVLSQNLKSSNDEVLTLTTRIT